jgi:flagellar transcriptional activator FlhD
MKQSDETVKSIHAFNMALLRLVQTMAREDVDGAAKSLGVGAEVVRLMAATPDSRLAELSAIPQLLCAFRFESQSVLSILGGAAAGSGVAAAGPGVKRVAV